MAEEVRAPLAPPVSQEENEVQGDDDALASIYNLVDSATTDSDATKVKDALIQYMNRRDKETDHDAMAEIEQRQATREKNTTAFYQAPKKKSWWQWGK